ncbi:MAG: AAA family ATPase, partial [Paludibacter sp.]
MELSFLGITYQSENIPDGIIMEELIALAFAAPCFTASSAKSILSADLKQVDIFKLRKLLIKDVINLRQNLDTNSDHNFDFSEKRSEWISIFGQIDSSDISCLSRFKLDPELFCKTKSIEHIPDTFNNPNEMFTYVSKFVKGQEQVLKTLSIYYFDHYLRVRKNISMPKISFVLIGKTGEGKSYTCSKFAEIINVPIIKINLVDIVPEGFVGKTICKELSFAYHKYNKDINVLKNSIIEFSEIDKIFSNYLSNNYRIRIKTEILRFFEKGNTIRIQEDHDYSNGNF